VTFIHPSADVAEGASVGEGSNVWNEAQLRAGARLGRGCSVGKGAYLSGTASVGDLVKVGNYANLMGTRVEDEAFVGPNAYLMQDLAPRSTNPDGTLVGPGQWTPRPATVRRGATIGGGALVLPGVTVGEWAMVAAGAVVHRDVVPFGLVAGNPARQVGWACRCGQTLDPDFGCDCGCRYRLDGNQLRPADTT
jgi:UDP-2-acetamido-3-amino-2,3-dideoxy-glucuronate N-acetyltransferase